MTDYMDKLVLYSILQQFYNIYIGIGITWYIYRPITVVDHPQHFDISNQTIRCEFDIFDKLSSDNYALKFDRDHS